jgi:hypothetical protein
VADLTGGRAVIVNALDEEALAFWMSHGFRPTLDDPMLLYRGMADIIASIRHLRP